MMTMSGNISSIIQSETMRLNVNQHEGVNGTSQATKRKTPETETEQRRQVRAKKPKDMPRRPLSAYNIFFREERARLLEARVISGEQVDSSSGLFTTLGRAVAKRWREITPKEKSKYDELAEEDTKRYRREMDEYQERLAMRCKAEQLRYDEERQAARALVAGTSDSSNKVGQSNPRLVTLPSMEAPVPYNLNISLGHSQNKVMPVASLGGMKASPLQSSKLQGLQQGQQTQALLLASIKNKPQPQVATGLNLSQSPAGIGFVPSGNNVAMTTAGLGRDAQSKTMPLGLQQQQQQQANLKPSFGTNNPTVANRTMITPEVLQRLRNTGEQRLLEVIRHEQEKRTQESRVLLALLQAQEEKEQERKNKEAQLSRLASNQAILEQIRASANEQATIDSLVISVLRKQNQAQKLSNQQPPARNITPASAQQLNLYLQLQQQQQAAKQFH